MARMRAEALLRVLPVLLAGACAADGPSGTAPAPAGAAEPFEHPTAAPVDEQPLPPVAAPVAELEQEPAEDVRDGAWLYERNCSGCHGVAGAGDGETGRALGVQPRDFKAGGFSFGNTPEDLFRTISAGIPGRSVMPAFGGVLSEEERRLVVEHVLTLMPPQEQQDPKASVLHVVERPLLARGKLPPAAEGRPELPRGLLLGLPAGLTFEYDVQDVAPVAVRLGPFADREDWRGRGGGYLKPLGQAIYLWSRGPSFTSEGAPLSCRLTASFTDAAGAGLEYDLVDAQGRVRAKVVERLRAVPLSVGGAFKRDIHVRAHTLPADLELYVAGDERTRLSGQMGMLAYGPRNLGPDVPGDVEAVWLHDGRGEIKADFDSGAVRAKLRLPAGVGAGFSATVLLLPDDSPERLSALAEELSR
jgi:mono/diheme cytochrome c family protein